MDQVKVKNGRVRRNFKWVATHLCVFTLLTPLAIASRTTGALGGQVLDPQGAAVPNAEISVIEQQTRVVSNRVTSSEGTWNLPSLRISAFAAGIAPLPTFFGSSDVRKSHLNVTADEGKGGSYSRRGRAKLLFC